MILSVLAALALLGTVSVAQQASEPACPLTSQFNPSEDYFPVKATVDPASGFSIEYKPSHKIVKISGITYVLNLCNAPTPSDPPTANAKLIKIPVAAAASESQNALDAMFALGVGHLVKFTKPFDDPVIPCAQAAKANASLAELTSTTSDAGYNVLFTSAVEAARAKAVTIPLPNIDATPLQKAEWIKLIGAFFNLERQANDLYKSIVDAYDCRKSQVSTVATPKPVVAWIAQVDPVNSPNMWKVNQGSYARTLISDAGGVPLASNPNVPTADLLNALSTANVVIDATPRAGKNVELIEWLRIFGKSSIQDVTAPFAQRKHLYAVDHTVSKNGHEEFQLGHTLRPAFVLQDLISVLYPIAQGTSYTRRYLRNMISDDGYAAPLEAAMCTAPLTPTSPLRVVPNNAAECPNVAAFTGSSSVMLGGDSTNSDQGKNEPPKRGSSAGVIFGAIVAVVFIAGFIVFVAPKLARKYRERKNRQYMQEML
ncbi:hypothetical protein BCR44DRAFT_60077 [Catenaria anguillulae PL171]|uniref:Periplasmic binding protein n=1 Tax=Catenaria anguillulae PL171 TaxID=765915 RepID=A0A1Y2HXB7_9FUNG|nr:hypothetical protein BCR44DRAFT_60077 [Catenaria anguillulae PL171]